MPGAARFSASDIPRNNRKAKTKGLFPNLGPCSEAVIAVFCCEDFWRARTEDIATCDAHHRRGARIPRSPAALDKTEDKSFAGSLSFFAVPFAFATPFSKDREQSRKSAGRSKRSIAPPAYTSVAGSSCIFHGSRFSYRGSRDRTVPGLRRVFGRDPDGRGQQSRSD